MDIRVDRAAEAEPARQRQGAHSWFRRRVSRQGGLPPQAPLPCRGSQPFPRFRYFYGSDSAVRSFIVRLHRIAPSLVCPGKSASKNLLVMSQLIEKPEARRPSGLDKVHGKLVSSVQEGDRNIM